MRGSFALLALPFILITTQSYALSITTFDPGPDPTGSSLVTAALAPSSGLNVSSSTFIGANAQSGTYTGFNLGTTPPGGVTINAPNGVLLTSGTAAIPLTNTSNSFSNTSGTGPNAELSALNVSKGGTAVTLDQNVLSLTFTVDDPTQNSVSAQFVFATDEYPTQTVTDIFGFFVDGVNYAFFPDGSLVSNQSGVTDSFFNLNPVGSGLYGIEYNGISNLLSVTGLLDMSLASHVLSIAIADTSDTIFDSGVFIGNLMAGTTTGGGGIENPPVVPLPAGLPLLGSGVGLLAIMRRLRKVKAAA